MCESPLNVLIPFLATIRDDPIFHNNSQNEQHPISEQLAIALYRFGPFWKCASALKVALWAGIGYGTVTASQSV